MDIQFSQPHLLRRLSFHHCVFLASLSKISWPYMHGCIYRFPILLHWSKCLFMPVPYYFNHYSFIMWFKIRKCDASSFVLLSQDWFGCLWSFVLPYELYNCFFLFLKKMPTIMWAFWVVKFLLVEVLPPCRWLLTDQVVVAEGWGGCGNFLK